jgi:hypothetical protein
VYPFRIVESFQDELLDPVQDGGIMPASRLAIHIEHRDKTAYQSPLTEGLDLSVDLLRVTLWNGSMPSNEIDVRFLLDATHVVCSLLRKTMDNVFTGVIKEVRTVWYVSSGMVSVVIFQRSLQICLGVRKPSS